MMIIALMLAPCAHGLPAAELAALADLYVECGGASWLYANGTDAVGGGAPWRVSSSGLASGDPCGDGWFGVRCDAKGTHVTQLFPNTRSSGNPLRCELPPSIGNLTELEHLYTSNDASPSALRGSIPHSLGRLRKLKCMYFSHNQLSGAGARARRPHAVRPWRALRRARSPAPHARPPGSQSLPSSRG